LEAGSFFESVGGRLINLNGATLTINNAADVVNLNITNRGQIVRVAAAGQMAVQSLTQSETGTLEVRLGGSGVGEFDQFIVAGAAELDGVLNVSLFNGFVPEGGETFNFISAAGGISGGFDTINWPSFPVGLSWGFNDDNPAIFQIFVYLPGDFNKDGTVDGGDYVVWRKDGGTTDDYNTWRSHFGQSIGNGATAGAAVNRAAVPEPPAAPLLSLVIVGWALARPALRVGSNGPARCHSAFTRREMVRR
jgi:hypothetical protein